MILNLSLNLPPDAAYIGIVRVISTTLMAYLGVAADKVADAAVVIGEICSNVVRHAHSTPEACYRVEVHYHADHIDLSVTDRGIGFRRCDIPEPTVGRAGGWGLWLVENLADSVVFEPVAEGGTAVRVRLNVEYRRPEGRERAQAIDRGGAAATATLDTSLD